MICSVKTPCSSPHTMSLWFSKWKIANLAIFYLDNLNGIAWCEVNGVFTEKVSKILFPACHQEIDHCALALSFCEIFFSQLEKLLLQQLESKGDFSWWVSPFSSHSQKKAKSPDKVSDVQHQPLKVIQKMFLCTLVNGNFILDLASEWS